VNIEAIKIREGLVEIFALRREGRCPTLEFLRKLKNDGSPDLGPLTHLLDETCENGVIDYNEYRFKNLKNGLYEFKAPHGARILCFLDNDGTQRFVICSTGIVKKKHKHAPTDIKEALRWRTDYFKAKTERTLKIVNEQ
jgi:hypothetical protein